MVAQQPLRCSRGSVWGLCKLFRIGVFRVLRNETIVARAGGQDLVNSLLPFFFAAGLLHFAELRENLLEGPVGGVDVALHFGE